MGRSVSSHPLGRISRRGNAATAHPGERYRAHMNARTNHPDPVRQSLGPPLLTTICALYLAIAASYSLMIPAWESNDETDHVTYIQHILAHAALPRIASAYGHESHQPPLYYALA